jgi:hypothetical protein
MRRRRSSTSGTSPPAGRRPRRRRGATIIQSLYGEIIVRGEEFVSVRLSPEAYAHGLALALPQEVCVSPLPWRGRPRKFMALARPTGFERADAITIRIPIEGATDGLMAEGA